MRVGKLTQEPAQEIVPGGGRLEATGCVQLQYRRLVRRMRRAAQVGPADRRLRKEKSSLYKCFLIFLRLSFTIVFFYYSYFFPLFFLFILLLLLLTSCCYRCSLPSSPLHFLFFSSASVFNPFLFFSTEALRVQCLAERLRGAIDR